MNTIWLWAVLIVPTILQWIGFISENKASWIMLIGLAILLAFYVDGEFSSIRESLREIRSTLGIEE